MSEVAVNSRGTKWAYTTLAAADATTPTVTGYTDLPCLATFDAMKVGRQIVKTPCLQSVKDYVSLGAEEVQGHPKFRVWHKDKSAVAAVYALYTSGAAKQWRAKFTDGAGYIFDATVSAVVPVVQDGQTIAHDFELVATGNRTWGDAGYYATLPTES